jgi:hypothetical protein
MLDTKTAFEVTLGGDRFNGDQVGTFVADTKAAAIDMAAATLREMGHPFSKRSLRAHEVTVERHVVCGKEVWF